MTNELGLEQFPPQMTLRDWFAGMALQGLIARYGLEDNLQKCFDDMEDENRAIEDALSVCAYALGESMATLRDCIADLELGNDETTGG